MSSAPPVTPEPTPHTLVPTSPGQPEPSSPPLPPFPPLQAALSPHQVKMQTTLTLSETLRAPSAAITAAATAAASTPHGNRRSGAHAVASRNACTRWETRMADACSAQQQRFVDTTTCHLAWRRASTPPGSTKTRHDTGDAGQGVGGGCILPYTLAPNQIRGRVELGRLCRGSPGEATNQDVDRAPPITPAA